MEESANQPDSRAALAEWYLRERWRILWHIPLTLGLALCLAMFILRGQAEDPRANIDKSRKAMLAFAPPELTKEENAAFDYYAADAAAKNPNVPATTSYNHLIAGAKKTRCNFGYDYSKGPEMPLGMLSPMRGNARMLSGRAASDALMGRHAQAAQAIGAVYAMSRHVEEDPLLLCGLVSIAMCNAAYDSIEQIIAAQPANTPLSIDELQAYRNALWLDQKPDARFARFLEAENAWGEVAIDQIATGTLNAGAASAGSSLSQPESFSALWYGSERRSHTKLMEVLIAKARSGETLTMEGVEETIRSCQTGPSVFTAMISTSQVFVHTQESLRRCAERALVVDAALAFLQYRAKHGRDAQSLDKLVPEFLSAVPKDPFHSLPLKMRRDELGSADDDAPVKASYLGRPLIRIYSFGPNGADEGGMRITTGKTTDDDVFFVPIHPGEDKIDRH